MATKRRKFRPIVKDIAIELCAFGCLSMVVGSPRGQ